MVGVDTFMVARLGQAAVAGVGTASRSSSLSSRSCRPSMSAPRSLFRKRSAPPTSDEQPARAASDRLGLVLAIPVSVGIYLAAPLIIALFGTEPDVAVAAVTYLQIIAAERRCSFRSFAAPSCGAGDSRTPLRRQPGQHRQCRRGLYVDIRELGFPALGVAGSALALQSDAAPVRPICSWRWLEARKRSRCVDLGLAPTHLFRSPALRARFTGRSRANALLRRVHGSLAVVALSGHWRSPRSRSPSPRCRRRSCPGSLSRLPQPRWSVRASERVFRRRTKGMGDLAALGAGLARHRRCARVRLRRTARGDLLVRSGSHLVGRAASASFALPFWAVWFVSSGSLRGSGDTRTPLIVGASTMWLSVLLAWIGVRWFDAGMGWVWTGFVLTSAPASILVWWIFRQRISDYERGRRELPEVTTAPGH